MTRRSSDLQADALGWLKNDPDVSNFLGTDGEVVPAAIAERSDADPVLAVAASATGSDRQNTLEESSLEVRIAVAGSPTLVETDGGTLRLNRLVDAAADVLTIHRSGWEATGLVSEDEVAWSSDLEQYVGAARFGIDARDVR